MLISSVTVVGWSTLSIAFLLVSVDGWVLPVVPGPRLNVLATSACTCRLNSFRQSTRTILTATTEQQEQEQQQNDGEEPQQQQQQQEPPTIPDILDGVSDFEDWFQSLERASYDGSIRHSAFGSLRGLKQFKSLDGRVAVDVVATVPKTAVLSSSYADKDWDSKLAILLWKECIKGKQSDIHG